MLLNFTLFSRLLFVSGLVCAAVMSIFVLSASTIILPVDNGVRHNALRSLNSLHNQNGPLLTTPLSTETGLQRGTNSETEKSGNYREALSVTGHQSNFFPISHDQNSPGNKQSSTEIIRVHRGHGAGAVWPASGTFTRDFQYGGQRYQKRLSNKKSPQGEAGSSFHQRFSQFWPHDIKEENPRVYASDETVWGVPSVSSLPSSQSGGYWNTDRIQSSEFLGFASQTAPRAPTVSEGVETPVTESNPKAEKLTSSITRYSQGLSSPSSNKKKGYKEGKSFLFKHSQTPFSGSETVERVPSDGASISPTLPHEQWPSAELNYNKLYSNLRKFQETGKKVLLFNNVRPMYHNVVLYGPLTQSSTKYLSVTAVKPASQTPTKRPSQLVSGKALESFAPVPQTDPQQSYATSSETPVTERPVNTVKGGPVFDYKPGQSPKILYSFKGFTNLPLRAVKELSSDPQYSFDKAKDYGGKVDIKVASLSPKFKFGLIKEFNPKLDMTPNLGILHSTQTTTVSTPGSTTSSSEEEQSQYYADRDSNRNPRPFQISKRLYSLKRFSSEPLEGAKASARIQGKSHTLRQDFEGFDLGSSQIWQLRRSKNYRWMNQTGEKVQASVSTQNLNMLQSDVGSVESVKTSRFSTDKYKRSQKTYAFLGFLPDPNRAGNAKIHWKNTKQNPTTEPSTQRVFLSSLGSTGGLELDSSTKSEPTTPGKITPVAKKVKLLSRITSSMVKGRRVKEKLRKKLNTFPSLHNETVTAAILRMPKSPVGVKAVPYTDILGSASFSSVRAETQAPTTPSDKENFPNTTATAQQEENKEESGEDASPEANAEDFSMVEEEKQSVKSEEGDSGMETFEAFFDDKGSGTGAFNLSDALSTDTTKTQALGEDLLELNYLQKSTGNIYFKSMHSHSDK